MAALVTAKPTNRKRRRVFGLMHVPLQILLSAFWNGRISGALPCCPKGSGDWSRVRWPFARLENCQLASGYDR